MIRKLLLSIIAGLFFSHSYAQINPAPGIAPFEIKLTDGQVYNAANLKKNTPVILVYFAPDCDHCAAFAKELMAHYAVIKNKQLLMITYFPLPEVNKFDKQYNLSSHPNIKVGTEGNLFIVQKYYGIQRFPFIVLYNRNGKEVKRFIQETPFQTVLAAFSNLQ